MAIIQREVCECDVCGHQWIPEKPEPARCPSRKCRSAVWNRNQDAAPEPPKQESKEEEQVWS